MAGYGRDGEGKLTGATLTAGGIDVSTDAPRPRSLPRHVSLRRSEAADHLDEAALKRSVDGRVAQAEPAELTVDVDGAPVRFELLECDGCWAATADLGNRTVTVRSDAAPSAGLSLRSLPTV